ncbi:MAG: hypothetical protein ACFFEY_17025 [Candidatus Thorarchaeota archaeon]
MRPSRVFRLIFKIFIYFLTLSVTIVSFLGALSAVMILGDPNNIGIDPSKFDLNLNPSPFIINFTLPFNITNEGYFDLENLEVKIDLAMNYTATADNETKILNIFNKSQNFGKIPKGSTGSYNFTGQFIDFYFPIGFNFTSDIDWTIGPPVILFFANFTINLDYSLGLHSLTIGILNIQIGGYPP